MKNKKVKCPLGNISPIKIAILIDNELQISYVELGQCPKNKRPHWDMGQKGSVKK